MSRSLFAETLKGLFDETNLFDRKDWSEFLGSSEQKIQNWLEDREIPRPDHLFMIIEVLKNSDGVRREPIKRFETVSTQRATEVSPFGKLMLPTVKEYMERPAFSDLSSQLAKLSSEDQGKLLLELYPE
jgi:hypothetical protein